MKEEIMRRNEGGERSEKEEGLKKNFFNIKKTKDSQ